MFKKITEISGHKCFQNFKWGTLPALAKFNLFYGWNGTGKTTLSNLFSDLEKGTSAPVGKASFQINAIDVSTDELEHLHRHLPKVRVFNQRYMQASVLSRFGNLEHIVFFGEKTVEDEKLRADSQSELDTLRAAMKSLDSKKAKSQKDLDTFKSGRAVDLKTLLRTSGNDRYTNYDKGDLERLCDGFNELTDLVLAENKRAELVAVIRTDIREPIAINEYLSLVPPTFVAEVSTLLSETPTSVAIQELVSDPQAASWVSTGVELHEHRKSESCLFCASSLEPKRIEDLRKHFDNSFRQQISNLKMFAGWAEQMFHHANEHRPVSTNIVYPHLAERLKLLNADVVLAQESFLDGVEVVRSAMAEKIANPFVKVAVPSVMERLTEKGLKLVACTAEVIKLFEEHNGITNNFKQSIADAKHLLELDFIAQRHETYMSLKDGLKKCSDDHKLNLDRSRHLVEIIRKIEEDQTETAAPAEALNKDICSYLGHSELTLSHHGKGYSIKRGAEEARDLSEGEKTALALLYFLKSLEDHRQKLSEAIIVIDDPVSSLDSTSMFTAFSFIKERTETAKQLIVLTHEFAFFHLVKGWFQNEQKKAKGINVSQYYSLVSTATAAGKLNTIRPLDKLLQDFGSEYQYLFSLVKKGATTGNEDLASLYGLPNVGRRLLEHFIVFKFPGGNGKEELMVRMKKLNLDAKTLAVLNRFLNIHSHGDDVAAPEHDLSLLSETPKVMQVVLDVMRAEDKEHVDRLEAAIA